LNVVLARWRRKEEFSSEKPENRENEKDKSILLLLWKFPIQNRRKLFAEKTDKNLEKKKRKGGATFSSTLCTGSLKFRYLVM